MKESQSRLRNPGLYLAFLAALSLAAGSGCGGGESTTSTGGDSTPPVTRAAAPETSSVTDSSAAVSPAGGPVMPNVDPGEAAAVTDAAVIAFSERGAGAESVWGPNVVEGWAILGMADSEGNDYQEMLLEKTGSGWVVRDIGQSLALKWKQQTPAGLWP